MQNRLELTGLIKVVGGQLVVRNTIYHTAFDDAWVRTVMPRNNRQQLAIASVIAAVLVVLAVGLGLRWLNPTDEDARAQALADGFITTLAKDSRADTPADDRQRLDSLDQLLQLRHDQATYREQALSLFYDRLSFDRQQRFFKYGDTSDGSKLIRVATAIIATLGPEDDGSDLTIITAIITGLNNVQGNPSDVVRTSREALQQWRQLRQMLRNNNPIAAQQLVAASAIPPSSTILGTVALPAPAYAFDIARTWTTDTSADTPKALAALQSMLDSVAVQPTPLPVTAVARASSSAVASPPATDAAPAGATSATQRPTSDPGSLSPPLLGNRLNQTQRFRNRQQIVQTIKEFTRAHPALLQALIARQSAYAQLADLMGVASVPILQSPSGAVVSIGSSSDLFQGSARRGAIDPAQGDGGSCIQAPCWQPTAARSAASMCRWIIAGRPCLPSILRYWQLSDLRAGGGRVGRGGLRCEYYADHRG